MIPTLRFLIPTIQRTFSRQFRIMSPSIITVSPDSITTIHDTIETNLKKGLDAASHDFRSDTVTVPTPEMLQTMFTTATFTDDIYSRDATTVKLEEEVAKLAGHEEAMFVPSGTLANQLCLRTHLTQPPHSVICDERAHIFTNESGGMAMFSQAIPTAISPKNGKYITLEEVKAKIIEDDVHYAPTRVVSLENTLHGVVLPLSEAKRISEYIRRKFKGQIKLHLDGILFTKMF